MPIIRRKIWARPLVSLPGFPLAHSVTILCRIAFQQNADERRRKHDSKGLKERPWPGGGGRQTTVRQSVGNLRLHNALWTKYTDVARVSLRRPPRRSLKKVDEELVELIYL